MEAKSSFESPELQMPPAPHGLRPTPGPPQPAPPGGYLLAPELRKPLPAAPQPPIAIAPRRKRLRPWLRALLLVPIAAIVAYTLYSYFLSAEAHYRRAEKAWEAHKYDIAAQEARAALFLSPRMGKAYHMLGISLLSLGQPLPAAAPLERAVELGPDEAEWHTDLGIAYHTTGRMSAAIAEHKTCIRLDPTRADGHHNLAMCYTDAGLYEAAGREYEAALARDPTDGQAHVHYAMMLEEAGKPTRAEALYKKVLQLPNPSRHYIGGPTNPVGIASLQLGRINLERHRPEAALAYFERAVRFYQGHRVPALAAAHRGKGEAYLALGREEEARREFAIAEQIAPLHIEFPFDEDDTVGI